MNNIAIFASREHHAEKLSAIYSELDKDKSNNVFWLTCNNSVNIDSPLEFLVPDNAKFVHVYTQLLSDREKKEIDILSKKFIKKLKGLSEYFSPFWIIHSSQEAAQLTVLFKKFIVEKDIKGIVVLHNANFFSRILSFIAQKEGVPVFSFQEGMLRDRDQLSFDKQTLSTDYTVKTFCWSGLDVEKYKEAGAKGNLVVGGLYHLDNYSPSEPEEYKRLVFAPTIPSEYKGDIHSDAQWLQSFCGQASIHFVFKPHPFDKEIYSRVLTSNIPTLEIMKADYIVSQHSSIMIEAVALGRNVAELNRTGEAATESLAGSAYMAITDEDSLANFIENGWNSKKWIKSNGYKTGNRASFIAREIQKCL